MLAGRTPQVQLKGRQGLAGISGAASPPGGDLPDRFLVMPLSVHEPSLDDAGSMKRLSVVIANYNYERFVGAAIDSALNLDWDDVEVVIVDDGSTDGSAAVIEEYADRVDILITENATQRVAVNRGFARSTGDVVIFLDSDDLLPSDLPAKLATVWAAGVAKVQFQVQHIDEHGVALGAPFPAYEPVPTPAQIFSWASRTSAYPTPPGSGNAYARWFLDQIFPVGPMVGDAADSACLAAAPFLGRVVSLPGVVVGYRQHDANDSDLTQDRHRFPREVARARNRWRFAQQAAGTAPDQVDERPLFRSRELLQFRISSRRLVPGEHPLSGDSFGRMLWDAVTAVGPPGPENLVRRVLVSVWCVTVLIAPSPLAVRLITARYRKRG